MNLKKRMAQFMNKTSLALRGKRGSSLGMVMAIGAALVIWVMAIMPLMTTTGVVALNTAETEQDYLDSRSSIEFAKSELCKIAETKVPYTFMVLNQSDDTYRAVAKKNGAITNTEYQTHVVADLSNDQKDVPQNNANGAKVAAICAVTPSMTDSSVYDIVITTYNEGTKGISYVASYTVGGSLLIYPESYKQNQALPLSDFVLVDGKLGANQIWKSDIRWNNGSPSVSNEYMLPWTLSMNEDETYANAGEYPAVFKVTAQAAINDGSVSVGEEIVEEPEYNQQWIKPTASDFAVSFNNGAVTVSTQGQLAGYTLAVGSYTLYYNGAASATLPTGTGKYRVTLDYNGSGAYVEGGVNVLPAMGLEVGAYEVGSKTTDVSGCKIEKVEKPRNSNNFNITLTAYKDMHARYAFSQKADGSDISEWQESNVFTNMKQGTYYFYCYHPDYIDDKGVYFAGSSVVYAGMVYPYSGVDEIEDGGRYVIVTKYEEGLINKRTYYTTVQATDTSDVAAVNISPTAGSFENGLFLNYEQITSKQMWVATKSSEFWNFSNDGKMLSIRPEIDTDWRGREYVDGYILETGTNGANFELKENKLYSNVEVNLNTGTSKEDVYLMYYNKDWIAYANSSYGSNVSFIKVPEEGNTTGIVSPFYKVTKKVDIVSAYQERNIQSVMDEIGQTNGITVHTLYMNGIDVNSVPHAGTYHLVGDVTANGVRYNAVELGTWKVTPVELSETELANMTVSNDPNDEKKVILTGSGFHDAAIGGVRYYGIKKQNVDGTWPTEYNWLTSIDVPVQGRLAYGTYKFAIMEGGTNNYIVPGYRETTEAITLQPVYVPLVEEDREFFQFNLEHNNGVTTPVWYELPDKITPSKITMMYGWFDASGTIHWETTYSSNTRAYGALIAGTDYAEMPNVFRLQQPLGVTAENGRLSSAIKGTSVYFMGESASINTYGNDLYVTADLLVLKNKIIGGGHVYVNPYSTETTDPNNTLMFVVNDIKDASNNVIFKARNFYVVPAGADINNVNQLKAKEWLCHDGDYVGTNGTTFASVVKHYFRSKTYPEINLDIAYTSVEQISHIVSSETTGWTIDGVLKGSSNKNNEGYVVCTFVHEMQGAVNYRANRVLIAAKTREGAHAFTVPANLTLTTRYLSMDAEQVVQGSDGVKFVLENLGQENDFIQDLAEWLNLTSYMSKTMQADYERYTTIVNSNGNMTGIDPQICRYDDGTNLFGNATIQPLLATYKTSEIKNMFGGVTGTAKTVDRYITIKSDDRNGVLNLDSWGSNTLKIYANYIFVDPSLKEVQFEGSIIGGWFTGESDIRVNSQESGYTTEEYLGWFQMHSAESYSGTLLYVKESLKITTRKTIFGVGVSRDTVTLGRGFYYLTASDNGVSLVDLADNPQLIDETTLKEYSVYIDPETGSLSNAYVDTGLFDSDVETSSGFSGGVVQ